MVTTIEELPHMFVDRHCPYCGEPIELSVDESVEDQRYVEDCQVCCRPIEVVATVDAGGVATVMLRTGDDA